MKVLPGCFSECFPMCWVKVLSGLCVSASCGCATVLRAAGFNITFAPGLMKCYLESAILRAARRKASLVNASREDIAKVFRPSRDVVFTEC